jgi:hypothetical protein
MGDWFQIVVDEGVSFADAEQLSREILRWLTERGIVQAIPVQCVLGRDELGYPPGPNCGEAVEGLWHEHQLLDLRVNGLQVDIGRRVYHPMQGEISLFCPGCGIQSEFHDDWQSALLEWLKSKGDGILRCSKCEHTGSVTEWIYDPPWGFGELGFTFWNWPVLRQSFVEEFCAQFGHRTAFVAGKL